MNNDYGMAAGLGIGMVIIGIIVYLGIFALAIWVQYLIMRTAVKNGVILALRESGQQFPPAGGYRPGGYPPTGTPPYGPQS